MVVVAATVEWLNGVATAGWGGGWVPWRGRSTKPEGYPAAYARGHILRLLSLADAGFRCWGVVLQQKAHALRRFAFAMLSADYQLKTNDRLRWDTGVRDNVRF